mgnify:CR=1 FL=1
MNNFYSQPSFPSQSKENFFPEYLVDKLLETYFDIQNKINRGRTIFNQITEVFLPLPGDQGCNINIIPRRRAGKAGVSYRRGIVLSKSDREDIYDILNTSFEQDLEITRLCLHNLHKPLPIHCDGVDITNKRASRSHDLSVSTKKHQPERLDDMFNQGLITLKNDNSYNGTVVFDQWFPISTYICTTETYSSIRPVITFFKGEKWERFGEHIRNSTGKPLSDDDWALLQSSVEDPEKLDRDMFFGLTIDKILYFGQPGTLNAWADKKYHASLPTASWSGDRINLQFETKKKGK